MAPDRDVVVTSARFDLLAGEGRQRVGVLREVPHVLMALGADVEAVFGAADLDVSILDDPGNEISFFAMGRLLQACVDATRCQHFGLLAGQGLTLRSLGPVGQLMQTAPTLEFALWDLVLSQAANADGAVCYLRRMGEVSILCYAIYHPRTPAVSQICDGAIALAFNAIRELAGSVAVGVNLSHAQPSDVSPFRRFFGVPLLFDSEESGVLLPTHALSRPISSVDPALRSQLQSALRAHQALSRPDISSQVVRILRPRIISGQVSIKEVAASLSIHPRSLLRKLKARGTTFRELLNGTRFEVACQLLTGTHLRITEIGLIFGYSETAAFTRWFEHRSGFAPSEWRTRHAEVPPRRERAQDRQDLRDRG